MRNFFDSAQEFWKEAQKSDELIHKIAESHGFEVVDVKQLKLWGINKNSEGKYARNQFLDLRRALISEYKPKEVSQMEQWFDYIDELKLNNDTAIKFLIAIRSQKFLDEVGKLKAENKKTIKGLIETHKKVIQKHNELKTLNFYKYFRREKEILPVSEREGYLYKQIRPLLNNLLRRFRLEGVPRDILFKFILYGEASNEFKLSVGISAQHPPIVSNIAGEPIPFEGAFYPIILYQPVSEEALKGWVHNHWEEIKVEQDVAFGKSAKRPKQKTQELDNFKRDYVAYLYKVESGYQLQEIALALSTTYNTVEKGIRKMEKLVADFERNME